MRGATRPILTAANLLAFLSAMALIAIVVINAINVIGRYFFHSPLIWGDEVLVFLMLGTVFLGMPLVAWNGDHIKMDMMINAFPDETRHATLRWIALACGVICLFLSWTSIRPVLELMQFDQRSEAAEIPIAIPQALIPIGLVVTGLVFLARAAIGYPALTPLPVIVGATSPTP